MDYKKTTQFAEKISAAKWEELEILAKERGFESPEELFGAEFYPYLKKEQATAKVRAGLYHESKDSTEVLDKVARYVWDSQADSLK